MKISDQLPVNLNSFQAIGKALRSGASQSASVAPADALEISGLAKVVSALGADGIKAAQSLGESGISEERLMAFIDKFTQSGTDNLKTGAMLLKISGFSNYFGSSGMNDLFSQVESRGVSGDLKYLDSLDNVFNLGRRDVSAIFDAGKEMSDEEFNVYLKSLTDLLKAGVIGTETVKYRGQPTQVFIENEVGSDYSRAPIYRERFPF